MESKTITSLIVEELDRANKTHGGFNSPYEGYAVIKEELDELWEEIKKKHPDKNRMHAEALQIGAMAMKFIISLRYELKPYPIVSEEKLLQNEEKCRQCNFATMTDEELTELGHDPCDTCDSDLCNWQPKEEGINNG